jgi:hypothetical protein
VESGKVCTDDGAIFAAPTEEMALAEPIVAAASHRAGITRAGAAEGAVPARATAVQKISPDDASRRNEAAILFSSKKIERNPNERSFRRILASLAYPDTLLSPTK